MKKTIITIFTILLIATSGLGFVSAENINETEVLSEEENLNARNIAREDDPYENNRTNEKVKASESGNYNISFTDGYNGYCIDYGKNAAYDGEEFKVQDTSKATNNINGESIGNYLKVFFVDYHDIAVKDKTATQQIIWGLSDNKNYYSQIVNEIKESSTNRIIPDQGAVKKINDTTEAVFYFEVLESVNRWTQTFFGYKIEYRAIPSNIINNTTSNDILTEPTIPENNNTNTQKPTTPENNNTNTQKPTTPENKTPQETLKKNTTNKVKVEKIINNPEENENKSVFIEDNEKDLSLSKHVTGNSWIPILVILAVFSFILIANYKRD